MRVLGGLMLGCWLWAGCGGDGSAADGSTAGQADGGDVGNDGGLLDASSAGGADASSAALGDATMTSPFDASDTPTGAGDASTRDAGVSATACALPAPFDVGVRYTRELHVATTGDDQDDGSAARPFRTIRAAGERATPGTRIVVAAGRYGTVALGGMKGEPTRPIAFVGTGAVIDAASGTGWAMSDAAYVVVEGFTIENAQVHGMNLDDGASYETPAHHIVLRNLTVRNAGSGGNNDCIKMSGVDDFWIVGSDVSECDRGEIIDMVGCHRGIISGNRFHDTVQNGVQSKGGSADITVHGNRFENIPGRAVNAGGSTGLEFFRPVDAPHEAARIRIVSNLFVRSGAMSGAAVAYVGCDGCVFAHNTLIAPQRWVARILQESSDARFVPSRNGLFANNLVVLALADLSTIVNVGANTAPATFTFGNNLWFSTDQPSWAGPVLGSGIPPETGSIVQRDPLLVALASGDYRPTASSPARAAGRMLEPSPPDYEGRCHAQPATIGAFAAP
jgi:hypothetical protein